MDLLNKLQLNISDCRGQAYDNGSNMKGKHQGVQRRVLDINHKALYMCVWPSLVSSKEFTICSAPQYNGERSCKSMCSSLLRASLPPDGSAELTVSKQCATKFIKALDHAMAKKDVETVSSCTGILKEIQMWKFLTCGAVWYNILYQVNHISKLYIHLNGC